VFGHRSFGDYRDKAATATGHQDQVKQVVCAVYHGAWRQVCGGRSPGKLFARSMAPGDRSAAADHSEEFFCDVAVDLNPVRRVASTSLARGVCCHEAERWMRLTSSRDLPCRVDDPELHRNRVQGRSCDADANRSPPTGLPLQISVAVDLGLG
jgi:hypothetical protein